MLFLCLTLTFTFSSHNRQVVVLLSLFFSPPLSLKCFDRHNKQNFRIKDLFREKQPNPFLFCVGLVAEKNEWKERRETRGTNEQDKRQTGNV